MASYPERLADNVPYRPRPFLEAIPSSPSPYPMYDPSLLTHPPSSSVLPSSSHSTTTTTTFLPFPIPSLSPHPLSNVYPMNQMNSSNPSSFYPITPTPLFTSLPSQSIQEINIPKKFVGFVIGKGGKYISEIREKSGCDVQLNDSNLEESNEDRIISIAGPNDGVQIALQMIFSKIMNK